jgi:hypothetical protein
MRHGYKRHTAIFSVSLLERVHSVAGLRSLPHGGGGSGAAGSAATSSSAGSVWGSSASAA